MTDALRDWKAAMARPPETSYQKVVGLQDIARTESARESTEINYRRAHCKGSSKSNAANSLSSADGPLYTLQLQHWSASHDRSDGHRFVLFRSDRIGAIGKLVYNVNGAEDSACAATIEVLEVKHEYRGHDLGGLLIGQLIQRLVSSPLHCDCHHQASRGVVRLVAKEDERRYGQLVNFYEKLGSRVRRDASVTYFYHDDGTVFRRVPMEFHLDNAAAADEPSKRVAQSPLTARHVAGIVDGFRAFLPVHLDCSATHGRSRRKQSSVDRHRRWIMTETEDGAVTLFDAFRMLGKNTMSLEPQWLLAVPATNVGNSASLIDNVRGTSKREWTGSRKLWMLQSTQEPALFLGLDQDGILSVHSKASYWHLDRIDAGLTLRSTHDTPRAVLHRQLHYTYQTRQFVERMHQRYLQFDKGRLSIVEALERAQQLPGRPFDTNDANDGISLRTRCLATADRCRSLGHPDWVQFVALVYHLGPVVNTFGGDSFGMDNECGYDWTISSQGHVVFVDTHDQFRHRLHLGNLREQSGRSTTERAPFLLTWTGPEYIYHMLRHNRICLPDEAFAMVRFGSVVKMPLCGSFCEIEFDVDNEFVKDFAFVLRQPESTGIFDHDDNSHENPWPTGHIVDLCEKYNAGGELAW